MKSKTPDQYLKNANEKRRMHSLNDAYQALSDLVPASRQSKARQTKIRVLTQTRLYIDDLHRLIESYCVKDNTMRVAYSNVRHKHTDIKIKKHRFSDCELETTRNTRQSKCEVDNAPYTPSQYDDGSTPLKQESQNDAGYTPNGRSSQIFSDTRDKYDQYRQESESEGSSECSGDLFDESTTIPVFYDNDAAYVQQQNPITQSIIDMGSKNEVDGIELTDLNAGKFHSIADYFEPSVNYPTSYNLVMSNNAVNVESSLATINHSPTDYCLSSRVSYDQEIADYNNTNPMPESPLQHLMNNSLKGEWLNHMQMY